MAFSIFDPLSLFFPIFSVHHPDPMNIDANLEAWVDLDLDGPIIQQFLLPLISLDHWEYLGILRSPVARLSTSHAGAIAEVVAPDAAWSTWKRMAISARSGWKWLAKQLRIVAPASWIVHAGKAICLIDMLCPAFRQRFTQGDREGQNLVAFTFPSHNADHQFLPWTKTKSPKCQAARTCD